MLTTSPDTGADNWWLVLGDWWWLVVGGLVCLGWVGLGWFWLDLFGWFFGWFVWLVGWLVGVGVGLHPILWRLVVGGGIGW